jgi:hypothetical protein
MQNHEQAQIPDTRDVPAGDFFGSTIRVRIRRENATGWPYAVELEYRYPEDGDDAPGDTMLLPLDVLGEIGSFVKGHCTEWQVRKGAS